MTSQQFRLAKREKDAGTLNKDSSSIKLKKLVHRQGVISGLAKEGDPERKAGDQKIRALSTFQIRRRKKKESPSKKIWSGDIRVLKGPSPGRESWGGGGNAATHRQ